MKGFFVFERVPNIELPPTLMGQGPGSVLDTVLTPLAGNSCLLQYSCLVHGKIMFMVTSLLKMFLYTFASFVFELLITFTHLTKYIL